MKHTYHVWITDPENFMNPDENVSRQATYVSTYHHANSPPEGWVFAGEIEFDFDGKIPDEKGLREKAIDGLRAEIRKVRGEAQKEVECLEDRIQRLLAIEHKPE